MKKIGYIIFAVLMAICVISCSKSSQTATATPATLAGNWSLVSDSTINGTTYKGVATDYYKFTASGQLYIKEGNFILDTAAYTIEAGDKISLIYSYFDEDGYLIKGNINSYTYSNFTGNSITLNSGGLSPEGYFGNIITLRKADIF